MQFFDDSFGEMSSFCKFVFDLFVDIQILFQLGDSCLEFLIFKDDSLGLFALIL